MAGEFTQDVAIAALERGRDLLLQKAEADFQVAVAGGSDPVVSQATKATTIATVLAQHTAAVARIAGARARIGSPR
jgi:hypothetical protein